VDHHGGRGVRAIGSSTTPASDIVEAQWVAERRGLARFRTEQPAYSILDRGIEREVLPAARRFGMGTLVWGLAGAGAVLTDDLLDRIDAIVPPGTDVSALDQGYVPPALQDSDLRRRPLRRRPAA
jgi:aryl-alcohol dehydrogenase-like predicted oxidoreductase